jgi:hypothetical protein
MPEAHSFPTSVVLGMWLNAAQTAAVSTTDAANAIEAITEQLMVSAAEPGSDSSISSWLDLVGQVKKISVPVAVGLPVDGDPSGVPASVLRGISRDSGVVSIHPDLLLCQNSDGVWVIFQTPNKVMHYDLSQTRRKLAEAIEAASKQLAASDLAGDESEILENLNSFRSLHLPPHLSKRSTDALELAARIMIIARGAIDKSAALHSPSIDRMRTQILSHLVSESRTVLQSVVTS